MKDKKPQKKSTTSSTFDQELYAEMFGLYQAADSFKAFNAALLERGQLDEVGEMMAQLAAERAASAEHYMAFDLFKGRQRSRFRVRPVGQIWRRMPYAHLREITEDPRSGTRVALIFTNSATVLIQGRNLGPIADAIDLGLCAFIQAYDPKRWPRPDDVGAPFIEKIEYP